MKQAQFSGLALKASSIRSRLLRIMRIVEARTRIDVLAVGEDDEKLEKGPGSGFEDVLAAGGQGSALNLEVLVDDLPLGCRRRNDGLVEVLA